MKTFAICGVASVLAFLVAAYPMGLYDDPVATDTPPQAKEEKSKDPLPRFPEDLARAVRQQPVLQAAAFRPEAKTHKLVIFKSSGAIHPWQEDLPEEWLAESVAETELVVVVLPSRKKLISRHVYPAAPPVERFQWEADAYVVEAKTGVVQTTRNFINTPRQIRSTEAFELTAIGEPVSFRTVFNWVVAASRTGFPREDSTRPLVNVVE